MKVAVNRWTVTQPSYCRGEKTLRESIIEPGGQNVATPADEWLDLDQLVRVEVTSEDPGHPIESAGEDGLDGAV